MGELALASTAADAAAVESIEQDAAELAGALDARVSGLLGAVRNAEDVDGRRADLVTWCEERLLTRVKAEESALYPAGTSAPEVRLLVEAMRAEHDVIARLVGELRTAALPASAVAVAGVTAANSPPDFWGSKHSASCPGAADESNGRPGTPSGSASRSSASIVCASRATSSCSTVRSGVRRR